MGELIYQSRKKAGRPRLKHPIPIPTGFTDRYCEKIYLGELVECLSSKRKFLVIYDKEFSFGLLDIEDYGVHKLFPDMTVNLAIIEESRPCKQNTGAITKPKRNSTR